MNKPRTFAPGDKVTVPPGPTIYTVTSVHDEDFASGGVQQVARITNDIRPISMRAISMRSAHLRPVLPSEGKNN